ncbi:MAG: DNA-directed RNA polymerase subunit beta, partial [Clostridiales bacterium]|nr:DNA-directed RNA polymerase subunit beta [Clostridiales bacterium]
SDDVVGRVKAYEAIVKGKCIPTPGIPESFKVLIKELQALGLDIKVWGDQQEQIIIREFEDDDVAMYPGRLMQDDTMPSTDELDDLDFDDITIAGDMTLADEVQAKDDDQEDDDDHDQGIHADDHAENEDDDLDFDFDDDDIE